MPPVWDWPVDGKTPAPNKIEWFEDLFGFKETEAGVDACTNVTSKIKINDVGDLENVSKTSFTHKNNMHVGIFSTESVADLSDALYRSREFWPTDQKLTITHLNAEFGVGPLHQDPKNAGAVFQAASQFNCLEMKDPGVSPTAGISIYVNDKTQGPACALACPAALLYRNYLVKHTIDMADYIGQCTQQINLLSDVETYIENKTKEYWRVTNGYLQTETTKLDEFNKLLNTYTPEKLEELKNKIRVGVHYDTSVAPPAKHRVYQVYTSALGIRTEYSGVSKDDPNWVTFAKLVLSAAYEATLCVAAAKCVNDYMTGKRTKCFLTFVGGSAFENKKEWITEAINAALKKYENWPIDVIMVHHKKLDKSLEAKITDPHAKTPDPTPTPTPTPSVKASCENIDLATFLATITNAKKAKPFQKFEYNGTTFVAIQGGVDTFAGHAMVNAANEGCLDGGGVDGAITGKGGALLAQARRALPIVSGTSTRCPTGDAKTTVGGDLPSCLCIHAVGPDYRKTLGTENNADILLYKAYVASIKEAYNHHCKNIGFCLISAGIFRGKKRTPERIMTIALLAILAAVRNNLKFICLYGYGEVEYNTLIGVFNSILEPAKTKVDQTKVNALLDSLDYAHLQKVDIETRASKYETKSRLFASLADAIEKLTPPAPAAPAPATAPATAVTAAPVTAVTAVTETPAPSSAETSKSIESDKPDKSNKIDEPTISALKDLLEYVTKRSITETETETETELNVEDKIKAMITHITNNKLKSPNIFSKRSLLTTLMSDYGVQNDIFKQHLPQLFSIIDIVSFKNIIYKDSTQVNTFLNDILLCELKKIDSKITDDSSTVGRTKLTLSYNSDNKTFTANYPDFLQEAIEPLSEYIKINYGNMLSIKVTRGNDSIENPFLLGPKVTGTGPGTEPGTEPVPGPIVPGTGPIVPVPGAIVPGTGTGPRPIAPETGKATPPLSSYEEEDEVDDESCVMPGVSSNTATSTTASKDPSTPPPTADEIAAITNKETTKAEEAKAQRVTIGGSVKSFDDKLLNKPNGLKKYKIPNKLMKYTDYGQNLTTDYDGHTIEHITRQAIVISTLNAFQEASAEGIYHKQAFINLGKWSERPKLKPPSSLEIVINEKDWGEATLEMARDYGKIFVCLNNANATGFGGGYSHGSAAQEENMFRRTDCHFSHNSSRYTKEETDKINGENGKDVYIDITNPRVCIKSKEERVENADKKISINGYDFLSNENIFPFLEMRAAAPDFEYLEKRKGEQPSGTNKLNFQTCVNAQLNTLTKNKLEYVVLGAFGCGAFNNVPEEVARYYYNKLLKNKANFKVIVFPIYFAGNGANNYKVFYDVFKYWPDENANQQYKVSSTAPTIPTITKTDQFPSEDCANVTGTAPDKKLDFKIKEPTKKLNSKDFGIMYFGFDLAINENNSNTKAIDKLRFAILQDTLDKFDKADPGYYHILAQTNVIRWANNVTGTNDIDEGSGKCIFEYGTTDSLEATHNATKKYGKLFACLNFANALKPGGGYTDGRGAQEENIFFRTDCHYTLTKDLIKQGKHKILKKDDYLYDHYMTHLINGEYDRVYLDWKYPRVCIRGKEDPLGEGTGFDILDNTEIFPFYELRSAAKDYRVPMRIENGDDDDTRKKKRSAYYADKKNLTNSEIDLRKRICAQLDTLRQHKLRYVVLGAFGTGIFQNHLPSVAKIYAHELKKREKDFSVVVFASDNTAFQDEINEQKFKK